MLACICMFAGAYAQKIILKNSATLQPVPFALVYNASKTFNATTGDKGSVNISGVSTGDSIYIQALGYHNTAVLFQGTDQTILLKEKTYALGEVVIAVNRFEEKKNNIPQQVHTINASELRYINQPTTAEVLQNSGAVLVQKSQLGGGSPILRGFEANKVLMVIDGVRMNNAIYRGGHLQNVITVDNNMLDKAEVVFGPGSVVYGSDALGGVMHFTTRAPGLNTDSLKSVNLMAGAFTRYATASGEKTGHFDFNLGFKKFASLTSFTYSEFGDLRQGYQRNPFYGTWGTRPWYVKRMDGKDSIFVNKDSDVQVGSGYKQYDLMQKFLFKQNDHVSHVLNFQYSTSSDVPRYDRLTLMSGGKPKSAEWYYGPQDRLLGSYTLKLNADKGIYTHANIVAAFQQIAESRHDRGFNKKKRNNRIENVTVYSLNADFEKLIGKNEIRYGTELTYNDVKSKAYSTDINTGAEAPIDTRYPDGGSQMQSAAVYATHLFKITPGLILSEGVRFSYVELNAAFNDKTFFPFPFNTIKQKNQALSGNLGLVYMPGNEWRFAALGSTGFRAPNVDDLTKVFESVAGNIIVPNPDLKPEYTYNGELTVSKGFKEKVKAEITGYYTLYKNAITTQNFKYNGMDSIIYNGVMSKVTSSVNAGEAYLYGTSASLMADVTNNFSIRSSVNYTYGRIKTDTTDYPLDHVAPVFGKTSFILNLNKFKAEFFVMYNGWKRLKNYNMMGEDNLPNATALGSPSWYTLNLRTSYAFTKNIQLQMALENILDQNYRVFASGISAPGRNFIVTLRANF